MDARLGSHIRVSQADVQGMGLNLAYFIARNGIFAAECVHFALLGIILPPKPSSLNPKP